MKSNYNPDVYFKKISKELYSESTKFKICLFKNNECKKPIVNAHTISKYSLQKIADENLEVYINRIMHVTEFDDIHRYSSFSPKHEKISKFSTFYGFCAYHDKLLFKEIEDAEIFPTASQILKFNLRTIAWNYYTKINGQNILKTFKNANLHESFNNEIYQQKVDQLVEPMGHVQQQLRDKLAFVKYQIENEQCEYDFVFFRIKSVPEFMCCEAISPDYDFDGNKMNNPSKEKIIEDIYCNISSDKKSGYVLLSWQKNYTESKKFVQSLLKNENMFSILLCYCFYKLFNFCYSIEWWENLSVIKKKILLKYYSYRHKSDTLPPNVLIEISRDFRKYVIWEVIDKIEQISD